MKIHERFLRYVPFETCSSGASPTCPSTPNQLEFGKFLVEERSALSRH